MSDYEQGGWQKADARVLGQILAAQNIVFALPNITRITEYYAQTLISIPGIAACRVCLGNKSAQAGEMAVSVCAQCEILRPRTEEDNPISPSSPGFKCILADQPDMRFMVVDSYQHRFGFFVLKIKDAAVFDVYQPFIVNLASYLALTLENRWQNDLLQKVHAELERKVEERTHDLLNANEELIASRRVALDMMQDAVEARQQAEQANAVLQREIAHRKHAEEALRQQYSTLRGIIDSTNAIIFSVDRQYRYTSFNQEHAAVMRALYDAEIEIGRSLLECMTVAEDREVAKRNLDRALTGEQLVQESYSGEGPRSRRYFQISHSPVKTETGDIIGVAVLAQDITDRREMEQALAVREREYRTLVEHSPDLIVRYNANLHRIYVNPAWEKASGLRAEEVINVLPTEIPKVPKPTITEYMEKLQQVLKTGSPQSLEFNWVNARSETLYLDYVIVPEYDQYGEITSVLSVGRDLTERRRAEEALRASEEKYRSLIQRVQTAIVLHDGHGRILICNPLAQHLLGLSEDHLLGKSLDESAWRFLREDGSVMPVSEYPVSLVLSSRQPLRGYISGINHPNGKVWTLVNAEPEFTDSGDISQVIVSFIDITEKKRAEELLRKLSRAIEQSPVSIIITDTTGAIEYVNPRFTELTGYTLEEVLGQNPNILKSDQTSPEEYDDLWKTIMSGGVWQGEFCNKKKNGELYWEWASISPVINHVGAITNFVAAKENITDRKRAEEAELRRRRIAETLVKAAGVLNSTLDLNQVLDLILQQLSRAIDCDSASFLEREDDALVISACQGFHKPHEVLGARFSLSPNTPLDHVFSSKIPFHVADVDQEYPHFHDQDIASHYIRTWLGVPILSKDRVIGVVTLDRLEVRPFTDEDIELAMAFANQSAIAIENAALHKQTQHYAEELERRVEERTLDLR
ncbi:MAG: PAS domain S-box protein, partial [Anaerolineae bacterium]|nr:PAS domain S-box protein [Anaerolineae bacterium]